MKTARLPDFLLGVEDMAHKARRTNCGTSCVFEVRGTRRVFYPGGVRCQAPNFIFLVRLFLEGMSRLESWSIDETSDHE